MRRKRVHSIDIRNTIKKDKYIEWVDIILKNIWSTEIENLEILFYFIFKVSQSYK